jgi:hypothetical protein
MTSCMGDYSEVVLDEAGFFVRLFDPESTLSPGEYVKAATDMTIERLKTREVRILRTGQIEQV